MENLGKYLLELRQKRDLSYKKIWEDIRLNEETIGKMENNHFMDLGDYGIAKAMVFNYARYLEADTDAVMREFGLMTQNTEKDNFQYDKLPKERKIMISPNFLWMIGIIIFVAILGSILFHAYNQGWLSTPVFLKSSAPDSSSTRRSVKVEVSKPDTLRSRMKTLSRSLPKQSQSLVSPTAKGSAVPDTTDYMGNVLGDSPLNVPLH